VRELKRELEALEAIEETILLPTVWTSTTSAIAAPASARIGKIAASKFLILIDYLIELRAPCWPGIFEDCSSHPWSVNLKRSAFNIIAVHTSFKHGKLSLIV
jgi:hypothetical protein